MAERVDSHSDMLANSELNEVISKTVTHVMNETSELTSEAPNSSKRRKQNDNQVRRPMNAFMVYAQVARKKVAGKYPNLSYRKLSKTLGELWRMLDDEERKPFVEEADRLRREHKRAHPTYKFKPQRRRKKVDKQCEGGSSTFASSIGLMNRNDSSPFLQGRHYPTHGEFSTTAEDLFTSPYVPRNDSANAVSSIWPFVPNNSSEHYFDSNIADTTRGFPTVSTITTNSNGPQQRQYIEPMNHAKIAGHVGRLNLYSQFDPTDSKITGHDSNLGRAIGSQNNQVVNVLTPEHSSDFNTTKFPNYSSPPNTVCFSDSYPHTSSMGNPQYASDTYGLGNRSDLSPFTRSTPVITSTNLHPQPNAISSPYDRNMFSELINRPSRNEPVLNFIEHM